MGLTWITSIVYALNTIVNNRNQISPTGTGCTPISGRSSCCGWAAASPSHAIPSISTSKWKEGGERREDRTLTFWSLFYIPRHHDHSVRKGAEGRNSTVSMQRTLHAACGRHPHSDYESAYTPEKAQTSRLELAAVRWYIQWINVHTI